MRIRSAAFLLSTIALLAPGSAVAQPSIIETIAGGGPNNLPALSVSVQVFGVLAGASGEIYFAAYSGSVTQQVFKIDAAGTLTLVAGGFLPDRDGVPATKAGLGIVYGMARDAAGNLFLADSGTRRVRRVDAVTGIITTVAGGGPPGATGDGIPAAQAALADVMGLALDAPGNLYLSEPSGHRVRRVDLETGIITTIAGTGTPGFAGDGGPATGALLNGPRGIAFDAAGNLYIADALNRRVRRVDAGSRIVSTVAGTGIQGTGGDGGPAVSASFNGPSGLALDAAGNLHISDRNPSSEGAEGRIRRVDAATGIITRVAGGGLSYSEGIPAIDAIMFDPEMVDVDAAGELILGDVGAYLVLGDNYSRVRRVDASTGLIHSVAGGGVSQGDGGIATDAILGNSAGLAYDASGNLFIGVGDQVRRVDGTTGIITLVAGDGTPGFGGDGGPATEANLNDPRGLAVDPAGNVFIADRGNHRIRRVDAASGIITTYAGNGVAGFGGDGHQARNASLYWPAGVALDGTGNLLIADTYNNRIRRVMATSPYKIETIAGDGTIGFGGDGGPALTAAFRNPWAVAVGAAGDILIADTSNARIRRVDAATGIIETVAGDGSFGFAGDGGPATSARFGLIYSLAVGTNGDLLIADGDNRRMRRVDAATGSISTVAGTGIFGYSGDGGDPNLAKLSGPGSVAADSSGGFAFGDRSRVRRVSATSRPTQAGEVPADPSSTATPLNVTHAPFGMVTLSWGASCSGTDTDYEIYEGALGSFSSHAPRSCGTGGATEVTLAPSPQSVYFLVVPRSFAREGSYGRGSDGVERPAAASACLPQEATACP